MKQKQDEIGLLCEGCCRFGYYSDCHDSHYTRTGYRPNKSCMGWIGEVACGIPTKPKRKIVQIAVIPYSEIYPVGLVALSNDGIVFSKQINGEYWTEHEPIPEEDQMKKIIRFTAEQVDRNDDGVKEWCDASAVEELEKDLEFAEEKIREHTEWLKLIREAFCL